jgi:hypothetical protein
MPSTPGIRAIVRSLLTIDRAPFLAAITGHPGAFAAAERQLAGRAI